MRDAPGSPRGWLDSALDTVAQTWREMPLDGATDPVLVLEDRYPWLEYLGTGNDRVVFSLDPAVHGWTSDVVVKLPCSPTMANVGEWGTWHAVKGTDAERWFAPVYACDRDGDWLVQRRVRTGADNETAERVADAIRELDLNATDVIRKNVGWIDDQPVVFDYPWQR